MSFQQLLIICDHFDNLINKIDVKTEALLVLNDEKSTTRDLNELREKQIETIRQVKEINLNYLSKASSENQCDLLDDICSEEYLQKIEHLKEDLIRFDCVLLDSLIY